MSVYVCFCVCVCVSLSLSRSLDPAQLCVDSALCMPVVCITKFNNVILEIHLKNFCISVSSFPDRRFLLSAVQGGSAVSQSSIETLLWSAYPPGSSSTRAYLCLFSANA